jgi:eukaryotic-like serine/threonine-protein kinase
VRSCGAVIDDAHDQTGLEATLANLHQTTLDSVAFEETVVPTDAPSWTSFHGSGRLPTITVRFAESNQAGDAAAAEVELELHDLLGAGGMGQVYRATQRSLGRDVAVKTVRDTSSAASTVALCDEAVVTGRLSHPNIIPVHALGNAADGRPLLVMKRVEGVGWNVLLRSLDHAFWKRNEIAGDDRLHFHLEVLRKVTHAIAFAHSHGVVHRDIKPDNVMIGDFGEVYLVDWGLAARFGTSTAGTLAGTPSYLAPEMLGGTVDARTDVYLLGATLFELLTGAPPHRGTTMKEVLHSAEVSASPTFTDDVPSELAELCTRSLARDPAERPASAAAFGDALDDHVRHRGSRALARTAEERLAQLRRAIEDVQPAARDLAEVRRLIAESRFAFLEARRGWSDNPAVSPGLDATLRLAVRAELDRRDAEAARAMLRELQQPDPALVRAVETLEASLAREVEERARLERLAHDLDPNVERGARIAAAVVVLGMMIGITVYVRTVGMGSLTPKSVFVVGLVMLGGLSALLVVMWRRVMRTKFNRRLVAWVSVAIGVLVIHRALALFDPSATVSSIFTAELLLLGSMWAVGSLFLFWWMLPVGIVMTLCTIPALAFPAQAEVIFGTLNVLAVASFIIGWRLAGRRADESSR